MKAQIVTLNIVSARVLPLDQRSIGNMSLKLNIYTMQFKQNDKTIDKDRGIKEKKHVLKIKHIHYAI